MPAPVKTDAAYSNTVAQTQNTGLPPTQGERAPSTTTAQDPVQSDCCFTMHNQRPTKRDRERHIPTSKVCQKAPKTASLHKALLCYMLSLSACQQRTSLCAADKHPPHVIHTQHTLQPLPQSLKPPCTTLCTPNCIVMEDRFKVYPPKHQHADLGHSMHMHGTGARSI